jgi:hypothetical protein
MHNGKAYPCHGYQTFHYAGWTSHHHSGYSGDDGMDRGGKIRSVEAVNYDVRDRRGIVIIRELKESVLGYAGVDPENFINVFFSNPLQSKNITTAHYIS